MKSLGSRSDPTPTVRAIYLTYEGMVGRRVGLDKHDLEFVGQVEVAEVVILGEWLRHKRTDDFTLRLSMEHIVERHQSDDQSHE
jgi:hypothetical protein